jgi:hypothetical protein
MAQAIEAMVLDPRARRSASARTFAPVTWRHHRPLFFFASFPAPRLRGGVLWNGCPVEEPDTPSRYRRLDTGAEQCAGQMFHPGAAIAQALEQSNAGKVRKAGRRSPSACRSPSSRGQASAPCRQGNKPGLAAADRLRTPLTCRRKGPHLAGGGFKGRRPAKPRQCRLAEFVQTRSVSHAMLESDPFRLSKPKVNAYGSARGQAPEAEASQHAPKAHLHIALK